MASIIRLKSFDATIAREWRNLADAPDLGSGGATHGGSSPPSRTTRSYTKVSCLWIISLGCLLVFLNAFHAFAGESVKADAKFKGSVYQNKYGRVVQNTPYAPPPLHYRLRSAPQTYRAWQKKNYSDDFEHSMRGPLYKETDLEYMLRTF